MATPSFVGAVVNRATWNDPFARPTGLAAGDLLIAAMRVYDGHTITPPSGWTEITGMKTTSALTWADQLLFYRIVGSGDGASDVWESSTPHAERVIAMAAFRGVDSWTLPASVFVDNTSGGTIVAPTVVAGSAEDRLVGFFFTFGDSRTITVSGMTERGQYWDSGYSAWTAAVFDEVLSASGSTGTRTATLGTARDGRYGFLMSLSPVSGPTITLTPDPASVQVGSARTFTATRSAPAGAGGVTYNLTSSAPAVATVPATATILEGNTTVTFNATGVSVGSANITATNAADSGETDTVALTVTAVTTKRAKFLVHPDFASATGITIEVNEAPTGGALTGAKLGFATGIAAEATLESGQAVIKVNAADVGASALAAGTSVRAIFKGLAASGSALGSGAEAGSVVVATGTIIEE